MSHLNSENQLPSENEITVYYENLANSQKLYPPTYVPNTAHCNLGKFVQNHNDNYVVVAMIVIIMY